MLDVGIIGPSVSDTVTSWSGCSVFKEREIRGPVIRREEERHLPFRLIIIVPIRVNLLMWVSKFLTLSNTTTLSRLDYTTSESLAAAI